MMTFGIYEHGYSKKTVPSEWHELQFSGPSYLVIVVVDEQ